MSNTKFNLEEAIMACWSTKEDLELLLEATDSLDLATAEGQDKLNNLIIGIIELHNLRSSKAFSIFEKLFSHGE